MENTQNTVLESKFMKVHLQNQTFSIVVPAHFFFPAGTTIDPDQ